VVKVNGQTTTPDHCLLVRELETSVRQICTRSHYRVQCHLGIRHLLQRTYNIYNTYT